jgi:hypothetical protein
MATWTSRTVGMTTRNLRAVWGTSGGSIYAVGDGGTIVHYTGNDTWSANEAPMFTDPLFGISGGGGRVVVAGSNGSVLINSGSGWNPTNTGTMTDFRDVWQDANEIFAIGSVGTYDSITTAGPAPMQWPTSGASLTGVWGSSSDLYFVGGNLVLHRKTSISETSVSNAGTFQGVWGADPSNIYAVGLSGKIYHSMGFDDWNSQDVSGDTRDFNGVGGTGPGDVWVVGSGGAVLHSTGSGAKWTHVDAQTGADLYGVWVDATDVFIVGSQSTIVHGRRQ